MSYYFAKYVIITLYQYY